MLMHMRGEFGKSFRRNSEEDIFNGRPEILTVNGRSTPMLAINSLSGKHSLIKRPYFLEYGYYQRLEAANYPGSPGIGIIRAYSAEASNATTNKAPVIPSTEEAMASDHRPYLFLISKNIQNNIVITARMDRHASGAWSINVDRPKDDIPGLVEPVSVDMLELPVNFTEKELVVLHTRRARDVQIDLGLPINEANMGRVYNYIGNL
jgi:hypothetical protein